MLKESLRPASPLQPASVTAQPSTLRSSVREDAHSGSTVNSKQSSSTAQPQHHLHPQLQQQLPEQVRQFAEAHRVIVIDSVRTDFQKHAAALRVSADPSGKSSNSTSFMSTDYASSLGVAAVSAVSQGLSSSISTLQQWQQHWLGSLLGGQAAMWGHTQAQWVSEAAQLVLDSSEHLTADSKRQASRMIAMLSAYALHDPDTGYCQGWVASCSGIACRGAAQQFRQCNPCCTEICTDVCRIIVVRHMGRDTNVTQLLASPSRGLVQPSLESSGGGAA